MYCFNSLYMYFVQVKKGVNTICGVLYGLGSIQLATYVTKTDILENENKALSFLKKNPCHIGPSFQCQRVFAFLCFTILSYI